MSEPLNVIALISGGKDSFFNLLHCIRHGHRVVALANLFPVDGSHDGVQCILPTRPPPTGVESDDAEDLNSFMYQTVGHEVVPLYAAATGLPLYRLPIGGTAVHHERDYAFEEGAGDETESMVPLLRFVMERHPEADALCSGAILSTYQRTRVESVALRLGLVPLAFLWKYPVLPPAGGPDEAQLLLDMADAGLEARIVKTASAGLDEGHLWERVTGREGVQRVKRALRRFGAAQGAVLGEGGEFETIVLDGPARLFKKRITVDDEKRVVVREGGGASWLRVGGAQLRDKPGDEAELSIRVPEVLDSRFRSILEAISDPDATEPEVALGSASSAIIRGNPTVVDEGEDVLRWCVLASPSDCGSITSETRSVVEKIQALLSSASLDAAQITCTLVIIRSMADFPAVNAEYGKLFPRPNPPSRITISCGDLLADGHSIIVYVTAPGQARSDRNGLHVQSRSYWAPANIGPYSQAIDVAVTAGSEPTGVRSVHVAGQIPLMPASMLLPGPERELQVTLSLQHLWRIGVDMKIQCWTSAVAYFARSSPADMQRSARLAGLAWRLAHAPEEEEEDDADVWDLKYRQHMLGAEQEEAHLPDWSILSQKEPCVPPFFAAEVDELPRGSAVEWHAHAGLSGLGTGDAEILHDGDAGWKAWHVIVRSSLANLVYTVVTLDLDHVVGFEEQVREAYRGSVGRFGVEASGVAPYLVYVHGTTAWSSGGGDAVVPCRTLWSMSGERVGCVALFRLTLRNGSAS